MERNELTENERKVMDFINNSDDPWETANLVIHKIIEVSDESRRRRNAEKMQQFLGLTNQRTTLRP